MDEEFGPHRNHNVSVPRRGGVAVSAWLGPGQGGWKWGVHTHWEANSGSSTNRRPPSPVEASSGAGEELPPHHEAPASPLAELVCCSGHPPAQRIHTGKQTLPGAHRGTRDSSDGMRAAQGDATPGRRQTWRIPAVSHRTILCSTDECQTKYGNANAWRYCTKVFDMLTIAALIDEQILCVHGGLSPDIKTLDQIRTIERNQEIPHKGAFCDLVWSDPEDVDTWAISPRGAGWLFGAKVTNEFVHINNLKLICRAHQLVHEGYKFMFDEKLVTVWSAPNYCYRCGNIASIMVFKDVNTREPKLFRAVPDSERVIPPRTTTPYFL
nr:PREDICTED: serine/threonine-protein phosphatase 6 catalytic subunit [Opisthocomus hoazin]